MKMHEEFFKKGLESFFEGARLRIIDKKRNGRKRALCCEDPDICVCTRRAGGSGIRQETPMDKGGNRCFACRSEAAGFGAAVRSGDGHMEALDWTWGCVDAFRPA